MCGIIAILQRRSRRAPPDGRDVASAVERAAAVPLDAEGPDLQADLARAATELEVANRLLFGPPGIRCLATDTDLARRLRDALRGIGERVGACERALDAAATDGAQLEETNAAIVRLRDAAWAIERDRLATASAVLALAGPNPTGAAIEACFAIQSALSALDRLEVRGRDSAGVHLLVSHHDLDAATLDAEIGRRAEDAVFRSLAVRRVGPRTLSFVYKRAAEIGELGDNVAALRAAIAGDDLLHRALRAESAEVNVLGHTRWASVGIISEGNAHPLNSDELAVGSTDRSYVVAALNGDVDNHAELVTTHGLQVTPEITTDAKVIPTIVARRLDGGAALDEAFLRTVQEFEGSVAIGAAAASAPDRQMFALRGSGQALYVGVAEDAFVVASEPYGVTELTDRYVRMDGETPGNPRNPTGSRGQIVVLERSHAGELQGITRFAYDGTSLPVAEDELTRAPVTTRDVDRGSFPHFLLKEITEAPQSFRKTLRGRVHEVDGRLAVRLGEDALPGAVRTALRSGAIRRILVIGQGTAAVAGQGVRAALEGALADSSITTAALPATELSGFGMRADMSDTLVVAISQSGTTTDTNRTVDLVRGRGALVVAIVNRRGSDLTDKADGVIYTSDGRDVEMSVASTKAFYAQIAAGFLLAFALADEVGCGDPGERHAVLTAMRALPAAMQRVIANREPVREAARGLAPPRRYWAVVGNGSNKIAAEEIRIKLSELCYKSIACDATEDKKHIDLSAEPLILVCAAGLSGSTADDVAKEVAIYRAHQSAPIVIASEGEERFAAASRTITVPVVHASIDFVLAAVVGHLFGYEAALAIDDLADPLREGRAAIERATREHEDLDDLLEELAPALAPVCMSFFAGLQRGSYDGQLEARTGVRLASLLRFATGSTPLESYQIEHGKVGTPAVVVEDLTAALTDAIEQLTRPIDAIKHQAKTVTVGISRADEALMTQPLVRAVLEAGADRESLAYGELRALAALSPLVARIDGYSRYEVDAEQNTIAQIGRGGVAAGLVSRTADNPQLRGTKHQVARERRLLVARGQSDQRTVLIVPETRGATTTGITLLHVTFEQHAEAPLLRTALESYRDRWTELEEAVTEIEAELRPEALEDSTVIDCLVAPIDDLAIRVRAAKAR